MKKINNFLAEKLSLDNSTNICAFKPTTYNELRSVVSKLLKENGMNADLNIIDTSLITDMHDIFSAYPSFNGDVSLWNVSKVTNMRNMFNGCEKFDCDLSDWDVSNVEDMSGMFVMCKSFTHSIEKWNVDSLKKYTDMFLYTPKLKKPSWYF